jgi:hypothetical protein
MSAWWYRIEGPEMRADGREVVRSTECWNAPSLDYALSRCRDGWTLHAKPMERTGKLIAKHKTVAGEP